jgi:hypothetical protein
MSAQTTPAETGLPAHRRHRLEKIWQESQRRRCAADFVYFVQHYVYVESKSSAGGRALFALDPHQLELAGDLLEHRYHVWVKARQLGLTTLIMAYALWLILFRPGARVLVLSRRLEDANTNLGKLKFMYRHLPAWMCANAQPASDAATRFALRFPSGFESEVRSFPATEGAAIGNTADLVILDEFAYPPEAAEVHRNVMPTTDAAASNPETTGAVMVALSTMNGPTTLFAQLARGARSGINQFHFRFYPWMASRFMDQTVYDAKFKEFEQLGTPWKIHSEYPTTIEDAFYQSSGRRFTHLPQIDDCVDTWVRGWPERQGDSWGLAEDPEGPLRLLTDQVDPSADYVLSLDPSGGTGGDYAAGYLLACRPGDPVVEIVGWYHTNVREPLAVARDFNALGRWFAGDSQQAARIVVEMQGGYGKTETTELRSLQYPNLYFEMAKDQRRLRGAGRFGLAMSWQKRPLVIDKLAEYLAPFEEEDGEFRCRIENLPPAAVTQLGAFVKTDSGRYEGQGENDDLVMGLGIAVFVADDEVVGRPRSANSESPTSVKALPEGAFTVIDTSKDFFVAAAKAHEAQNRRFREQQAHRNELRRDRPNREMTIWPS